MYLFKWKIIEKIGREMYMYIHYAEFHKILNLKKYDFPRTGTINFKIITVTVVTNTSWEVYNFS